MNRNHLITLLSLLFLYAFSFAQNEVYNNGALIHVQGGALVHVQGEVYNAGVLENEGEIELEGDWTNQGSYIADVSGLVEFLGDNPSTINGNMVGQNDFYRLQINKTSATSTDRTVDLSVDIDVDDQLMLSNGRIVTYTNLVYVTPSLPTAVVGHDDPGVGGITTSSDRYIQGSLKRSIAPSFEYDYPVGDAPIVEGGKDYQLAKFDIINTFGSNYITVRFEPSHIPAYPPITIMDCNTELCGSLSGVWATASNITKPQYNLSLYPRNYTEHGCTTPAPNRYSSIGSAVLTGFYGQGGIPCYQETSMSSGKHLYDPGYNGLLNHSIGFGNLDCGRDVFEPNQSSASAAPLPEVGVNQNARICEAGDEDWYSIVIDSDNNIALTLTGLVADGDLELYDSGLSLVTSSTNMGQADESVILNNATIGATYFVRVFGKNDDFDPEGYNMHIKRRDVPFTSIVKATASIDIKNPEDEEEEEEEDDTELSLPLEFSAILYPNPATAELNLDFIADKNGEANIRLSNMMGQTIRVWNQKVEEGSNHVEMDVSSLAEGMYFVTLLYGTQKKNFKVEIMK